MKKALIIASVASMIDQFNLPNIMLLSELGYTIDVACNFQKGNTCTEEKIESLKEKLSRLNVNCHQIDFTRKVFRMSENWKAYKQLKERRQEKQYDLVLCQSPIGGILGRLVFKKQRKYGTKIIYLAHGFHFYKGAPWRNWVLYYPLERCMGRFTDMLITINREDYALAKEKIKAKRVEYVPGIGIDTETFSADSLNADEKKEKRQELGLEDGEKVILSVGELSRRKNHSCVIRALSDLKQGHWKYYICGKGELEGQLRSLINELDLQDRVHLLGFRTDVSELYSCADLFVFPSLQEGLPVALMEAIASKVPVVCSNIRGNTDLVQKGLFNVRDISDIREKIEWGLVEGSQVIEENYEVLRNYGLSFVNEKMKSIFLCCEE